MDIQNSARQTLRLEADSISKQIEHINADFERAVHKILKISGRVIITGIGKSAKIAQKIVATLNSTGTPAVFMHAADAIHGDLGNVQKEDVVICISKSGSSPEIKVLVPLVKSMGNTLIAIVGNLESFLAKQADIVINTTVDKEACPNNLAPTTSTTAQLAMGDALAVCLMEARGFSSNDFARYHPGGALGKKLFLRCSDLTDSTRQPSVKPDTPLKEVIVNISSNRLGATAVISHNKLVGIVTDGDLRRMLEKHENLNSLVAADIMTANPKFVEADDLAVRAFEIMEKHNITQLPVLDNDIYTGIIHLHEILKEGIY
jgi:arabinose-5-phosphate isomerase